MSVKKNTGLYYLCVTLSSPHAVYRLFTYAPYHSNLLHLILNMLFLSSVGVNLESRLGSYYLLNVVIIFGATCAVVQMSLEVLISYVYPDILEHCLTGFSGILFGILILSLAVSKSKKQSIYGLLFIPKALYPWLLLAVCQVVYLEHISIIANLAGILTGYACILSVRSEGGLGIGAFRGSFVISLQSGCSFPSTG